MAAVGGIIVFRLLEAGHSFVSGSDGAYLAGILAILLGAGLVCFLFPRKDQEDALLVRYAAEDSARVVAPGGGGR